MELHGWPSYPSPFCPPAALLLGWESKDNKLVSQVKLRAGEDFLSLQMGKLRPGEGQGLSKVTLLSREHSKGDTFAPTPGFPSDL